jgi:hypothetical protein
MTDSKNRIIVVDGQFRSAMLEAMARLVAAETPGLDQAIERIVLSRHDQLPPPMAFLPALREPKVRDWQEREKRLTRPKRKKAHKRGRR